MKEVSELFEQYPGYFNSLHNMRKEEENPRRRVIIISQPRSGSTLLLRLLKGACMTRCIGDRAPIYYESLVNIYKDIKENQGLYGYGTMIESGPFPDQFRGYQERWHELESFKWNLSGLLFGNNFGSGFTKTTMLGFANNITKDFTDMLRDVYEYDDLRIVWLRRDHEDIVKSLMKVSMEHKEGDDIAAMNLLEKQRKEHNASYQLGDIVVKYSDLVADPIAILKKLNPMYAPDKKQVERIMNNVMR